MGTLTRLDDGHLGEARRLGARQGTTLTADDDFSRFAGIEWRHPPAA